MKFNNILACFFLFFIVNTYVFSITYDFNVGVGVGVQTTTFGYPDDQGLKELYFPLESILHPNWKIKNDKGGLMVDSLLGLFLGAGITFETNSPQSLGLEYGIYFLYDYALYDASLYFYNPKENYWDGYREALSFVREGYSLQHNLDFYYKVQFSQNRTMAFQFNLGLAMVNPFIETSDEYQYLTGQKTYLKYENLIGLGLHTSARFNFSMFYMQLDYRYVPVYLYKGTSYESDYLARNKNQVGFTIGVLFNKGILEVWSNKSNNSVKKPSSRNNPEQNINQREINYDHLERIKNLFERGILTQEEFDREKDKILNS